MRASQLAMPGRLRNAQDVRRSLAWLISQAEIAVARGQGPELAFAQVKDFLASATTYVLAAAPSYALTVGTPVPTSIAADNVATSSITFNVKANGVNKAGVTVTFTKTGPQAATCTLSAASGVTDASGNVTVTIKGTAAGTAGVMGAINVGGFIAQTGSSAVTLT